MPGLRSKRKLIRPRSGVRTSEGSLDHPASRAALDVVVGLGRLLQLALSAACPFFLSTGFLNGFGAALFGQARTVFRALMNRTCASGPSIISG
jgi:hypothetical protein